MEKSENPALLRRFPRRTYTGPVGVLYMSKYKMGQAQELGEGGMLLLSNEDIESGRSLTLSFFIPAKGFVCVLGQVLYVKKNDGQARQIGVKFLDLEFGHKRMIREYIALKTTEESLLSSQLNI